MKRLTRNFLIIFFACLAAGGLVVFFLLNFQRVEEDVYVGYRGEARSNDYLAAERLLNQWKYKVTRIYSQAQLLNFNPPEEGLVFFLTDTIYFNRNDLKKFIPWVEAGGHLIVGIDSHFFDEDGMLSFGDYFADIVDTRIEYLEDKDFMQDETEKNNFFFELSSAHIPLSVKLDRTINFVDPHESESGKATWKIGDSEHTYLIQHHRGRGKVSLMGKALFMENHRLAEDDNAFFLWYLIIQEPDITGDGKGVHSFSFNSSDSGRNESADKLPAVWFISDKIVPTLAELVWVKGWPVIISLGLFILCLGFRVCQRFGPILESRSASRRSLLEYLTASGRFLWRSQNGLLLAETTRLAVKNQLLHKYRYLDTLTEDEQLAKIPQLLNSGKTDITCERDLIMLIRSFNRVQPPVKMNATRFFNIIKILERMRKVL